MLDALGSRADNLFLFVLWTDWEIEASQFKIPTLLPMKLDHDYSLWPNGLPHAFSPQVLNSVHPIPGRLAGHSCLWVERESLCPEDKRLLKRKRVSHVRIMTSNTLAPFSTAVCSQSGPYTSSISITSKLVGNVDWWSLTQMNWRRDSGVWGLKVLWFCCS